MKRLNDTAALTGMTPLTSHSVEVRKIDNGYVTRHSKYDGDRFESSETYSPDRPVVEAGAKLNPLRRAIEHIDCK